MTRFYIMSSPYERAFAVSTDETECIFSRDLSVGAPARNFHVNLTIQFDSKLFAKVRNLDIIPCHGAVPVISERFAKFIEEYYPSVAEVLPVSILVDGSESIANSFFAINVLAKYSIIDFDKSLTNSIATDEGKQFVVGFEKVELFDDAEPPYPFFRIMGYESEIACIPAFRSDCLRKKFRMKFYDLERILSYI